MPVEDHHPKSQLSKGSLPRGFHIPFFILRKAEHDNSGALTEDRLIDVYFAIHNANIHAQSLYLSEVSADNSPHDESGDRDEKTAKKDDDVSSGPTNTLQNQSAHSSSSSLFSALTISSSTNSISTVATTETLPPADGNDEQPEHFTHTKRDGSTVRVWVHTLKMHVFARDGHQFLVWHLRRSRRQQSALSGVRETKEQLRMHEVGAAETFLRERWAKECAERYWRQWADDEVKATVQVKGAARETDETEKGEEGENEGDKGGNEARKVEDIKDGIVGKEIMRIEGRVGEKEAVVLLVKLAEPWNGESWAECRA